jgi:hypothetical protein
MLTSDAVDQSAAGRALLATVVLLAVSDACTTPQKPRKGDSPKIPMPMEAFTAMRFLFDTSVSGLNEYAMWLDFDPDQFRRKLLATMADNSANVINGHDSTHRRHFRINYNIWRRIKNLDVSEGDDE